MLNGTYTSKEQIPEYADIGSRLVQARNDFRLALTRYETTYGRIEYTRISKPLGLVALRQSAKMQNDLLIVDGTNPDIQLAIEYLPRANEIMRNLFTAVGMPREFNSVADTIKTPGEDSHISNENKRGDSPK